MLSMKTAEHVTQLGLFNNYKMGLQEIPDDLFPYAKLFKSNGWVYVNMLMLKTIYEVVGDINNFDTAKKIYDIVVQFDGDTTYSCFLIYYKPESGFTITRVQLYHVFPLSLFNELIQSGAIKNTKILYGELLLYLE
jgi:hypothetical protein